MTSDDLVPRILAAIEDREKRANDCLTKGRRWWDWQQLRAKAPWLSVADAVFIHLHDPEAELRRCEAGRRLLELHAQVPTHDGSTETGCKLCLWEYSWGCDVQEGICETVQILAEGYGVTPATEPADRQETT